MAPQDPNIIADSVRSRLVTVERTCRSLTAAVGPFKTRTKFAAKSAPWLSNLNARTRRCHECCRHSGGGVSGCALTAALLLDHEVVA
jgi:hypothetical protein